MGGSPSGQPLAFAGCFMLLVITQQIIKPHMLLAGWVLACGCHLSIEESRKRKTFCLLNMYFAIFSEFPNLQ